jgi:bacterial/archaeal transporter family protein
MLQLLIVLYFFFATTNVLLRRVLARDLGEHNYLINAVFFLFFLFPLSIVLGFFFPHNLNIGLANVLLIIFGNLIWPIAYICAFRANKEVDAGIYVIITNLSPLFTLAIALTFLQEDLTRLQFVGIGLLISSGVLAASTQRKKQNRVSTQGLLICIFCAALFGSGVAYEGFMLQRVDLGTYILLGWASQTVWALILAGKHLRKLPQLFYKGAKKRRSLIVWGATNALKAATFIVALKISGSASIMSASSNFIAVAVVISAYFFLHERQHMLEKWLAAGIGIAGLFLIAS